MLCVWLFRLGDDYRAINIPECISGLKESGMTAQEQIKKVEALRKQGLSVADACLEVGIAYNKFYNQRKKIAAEEPKTRRKYTKKSKIIEIPILPSSPNLAAFYGSPEAVVSAIRSMQ
jgi:hypothetical protein